MVERAALLRRRATDRDLGELRAGQGGQLGDATQHRDRQVDRVGGLDGEKVDAVRRVLGVGDGCRGAPAEPGRGGENAGRQWSADRARLQQAAGVPDGGGGPALQADHRMHAGGLGCRGELLALLHVEPERVFAVDVLARRECPLQERAVGGERDRNGDQVDAGVGEQVGAPAIRLRHPEGMCGAVGRLLRLAAHRRELEPGQQAEGRDVRLARPATLGARADQSNPQHLVHLGSPCDGRPCDRCPG